MPLRHPKYAVPFDPEKSRRQSALALVLVRGLKHGFLKPRNPTTPETDFGSTAGALMRQLAQEGYTISDADGPIDLA